MTIDIYDKQQEEMDKAFAMQGNLTPAARRAVSSEIEQTLDTIRSTEKEGIDPAFGLAFDWTSTPARSKFALAIKLEELVVNDTAVAGGVLDRALDEVIAALTPYVERLAPEWPN